MEQARAAKSADELDLNEIVGWDRDTVVFRRAPVPLLIVAWTCAFSFVGYVTYIGTKVLAALPLDQTAGWEQFREPVTIAIYMLIPLALSYAALRHRSMLGTRHVQVVRDGIEIRNDATGETIWLPRVEMKRLYWTDSSSVHSATWRDPRQGVVVRMENGDMYRIDMPPHLRRKD